MPSIRPIPIRRVATAALAGAMILAILPAASTMAYNEPPVEVKTAEWKVLSHINHLRARHDLKPLRMATHVRLVARDRSRSMKNKDYFDHTSPSGVNAAGLMNSRGVRYNRWGENIGWTKNFGLEEGGKWMVDWWKNSPGHRRNMLNVDWNYVGIGIAVEGATIYWTTVFVNQRDHTPPKAGLVSSQSGIALASVSPRTDVTVRWWGKDRPLSTRTAGLRSFTVQYREGDGRWVRIRKNTTQRSLTKPLPPGTHSFRVRATDRKGNKGEFMRPLVVTIR